MTSPESSPIGRMFIPMGGDNSCGKSALAKEISHSLRHPEDGHEPLPTFVSHAGDFFRHMAGLPAFPLDTPAQIEASAAEAVASMHFRVDEANGEIFITDGHERFVQNVANGCGGSKLGANPHLADFVGGVIFDLFAEWLPDGQAGVGLVEGREDWGITGLAIRVTAPLNVRREFFRQERLEATHWDIDAVKAKIHERDTLDAPILAPLKARENNIIDVTRVDNTESATRQLARQISGMIFDYREGKIPQNFGVIPVNG